jgi:predicted RNase H-like nuclease (RuvC/YqgF family)
VAKQTAEDKISQCKKLIAALKTENRKLQNEVAKYQAQNYSLQNRVAALQKQLRSRPNLVELLSSIPKHTTDGKGT